MTPLYLENVEQDIKDPSTDKEEGFCIIDYSIDDASNSAAFEL